MIYSYERMGKSKPGEVLSFSKITSEKYKPRKNKIKPLRGIYISSSHPYGNGCTDQNLPLV